MGSQTYKHSTRDQTTSLVEDIYLPDMTQCGFYKRFFKCFGYYVLCITTCKCKWVGESNFLFCSSNYNKILWPGWLKPLILSQLWREGSPGSRCWQIWYLVRSCILSHKQLLPYYVLTLSFLSAQTLGEWAGGRESSQVSFCFFKSINSIMKTPSTWPHLYLSPQRLHLQIRFKLGFQDKSFEGTEAFIP